MNRSARLLQIILGVLLTLPTAFAFWNYAGDARHLGRLEADAGSPKPVAEPKPEVTGSTPSPVKADEKQGASSNNAGRSPEGKKKRKSPSSNAEGSTWKRLRGSGKTNSEEPEDYGQLNLNASGTAEVYVDGQKVGVAPVTRHVPTGRHKVRFDCLSGEGRKQGANRTVEVPPFSEVSVDFECQ